MRLQRITVWPTALVKAKQAVKEGSRMMVESVTARELVAPGTRGEWKACHIEKK